MKIIATLSILFTIPFFVLTSGKPNAVQACPSTTLWAPAEVEVFVGYEVYEEQTISRNNITNLNRLLPSPRVSGRLIIWDNSALLNIDWLRISNQSVVAYQLPATTTYYRYESYHPRKEEHF